MYEARGGMKTDKGNQNTKRKPASILLRTSEIPHDTRSKHQEVSE
jgi:hypothetical protein